VSQTNCVGFALSNILVFVELDNFYLFHGIDFEVLSAHDHLLVPVIDLFLAHLSLFFHHVISRDKYGIEILLIRKGGSLSLHFGLKVWLAVFSWDECVALKLIFSFEGLDEVWNLQVINCRLIRFLGMLVPVLSFHNIVKTAFSFPSSLIFLFCFLFNLVFIYDWES
jgi:hypothetical protein